MHLIKSLVEILRRLGSNLVHGQELGKLLIICEDANATECRIQRQTDMLLVPCCVCASSYKVLLIKQPTEPLFSCVQYSTCVSAILPLSS